MATAQASFRNTGPVGRASAWALRVEQPCVSPEADREHCLGAPPVLRSMPAPAGPHSYLCPPRRQVPQPVWLTDRSNPTARMVRNLPAVPAEAVRSPDRGSRSATTRQGDHEAKSRSGRKTAHNSPTALHCKRAYAQASVPQGSFGNTGPAEGAAVKTEGRAADDSCDVAFP